jgi:hypothetical protein
MNWLSLILALVPGIIHGVQVVVGDKASGATKKQMAKDALAAATGTAANMLTGDNATMADAASQITGLVIDQAVSDAKAKGTYQKATAIATEAHKDSGVATAVDQLVASVQVPAKV